ncbi:peptidoglycan editing factor PgeF [Bacillus sp. FJAT-45350]|uniref:peptidoglycan editing factor PgeF n=1 Tax=Bacillus sp. FJAT-45350 TaxID=2011014 RepID=UPI00211BAEBF|nr:peptidoglycan editing factor PgeF [Bacillus sp. FJAT-45350]
MLQDPFALKNSKFLTIPLWEKMNCQLQVGFTVRNEGYSSIPFESFNLGLHVGDRDTDVGKNRELLVEVLHSTLEDMVVGEQIHQGEIAKVSNVHRGAGAKSLDSAIKGVDGLYTSEKDVLLTSLYADCVPLYFFAPTSGLIGLAHAGWKGTVSPIGPNMIDIWNNEKNVAVEDIHVAIGPSISGSCYEVDSNVITHVDTLCEARGLPLPYQTVSNGKYLLDLKELNKQLLLNKGVLEKNILVSQYCTVKNNNLFFSHRKEKGKTGRMMSFIRVRAK